MHSGMRGEQGQSMAEYAVILALVALAAVAGFSALGQAHSVRTASTSLAVSEAMK